MTLTSAIVGIGPEMKLTRGTKPVATFWQNLGGCHSSTLSANKGKRVRDEDEYFTYPSRPVNCVDKVGN